MRAGRADHQNRRRGLRRRCPDRRQPGHRRAAPGSRRGSHRRRPRVQPDQRTATYLTSLGHGAPFMQAFTIRTRSSPAAALSFDEDPHCLLWTVGADRQLLPSTSRATPSEVPLENLHGLAANACSATGITDVWRDHHRSPGCSASPGSPVRPGRHCDAYPIPLTGRRTRSTFPMAGQVTEGDQTWVQEVRASAARTRLPRCSSGCRTCPTR